MLHYNDSAIGECIAHFRFHGDSTESKRRVWAWAEFEFNPRNRTRRRTRVLSLLTTSLFLSSLFLCLPLIFSVSRPFSLLSRLFFYLSRVSPASVSHGAHACMHGCMQHASMHACISKRGWLNSPGSGQGLGFLPLRGEENRSSLKSCPTG